MRGAIQGKGITMTSFGPFKLLEKDVLNTLRFLPANLDTCPKASPVYQLRKLLSDVLDDGSGHIILSSRQP